MSTLTAESLNASGLSEQERRTARAASRTLIGIARRHPHSAMLEVTDDAGKRTELSLPTETLALVARMLQQLSEGHTVTLVPTGGELTTRQAAAILRVSRPYLVALLDAGEIPFHRVGTHRRVRYEDLSAYQEQKREAGFAALAELTAMNEALGLYDEE